MDREVIRGIVKCKCKNLCGRYIQIFTTKFFPFFCVFEIFHNKSLRKNNHCVNPLEQIIFKIQELHVVSSLLVHWPKFKPMNLIQAAILTGKCIYRLGSVFIDWEVYLQTGKCSDEEELLHCFFISFHQT